MFGSSVRGQSVTLTWNAGNASDIAGYKVYYGDMPRTYSHCIVIGLVTEYTVYNISDSTNTYFAVTAFDSSGNESDYSEEVHTTVQNEAIVFSLKANYPNPFNPVTQIPFVLYQNTRIFFAVYDMLGRRVKVLANGNLIAGHYVYSWNGTNQDGTSVANGIYFCRLIVGDFCQTQKLILAR